MSDVAAAVRAIASELAATGDGAAAVYDARGALLAQTAPRFTQLGVTAPAVRRVVGGGPALGAHDVLLTNDPFQGGGTSLPELVTVAPAEAGGRRCGYVALVTRAADVGGVHAGGVSPNAHEIFSEGLRIPPVRLLRDGAESASVVRLIERNIREPEAVLAALRRQVGALTAARDRLAELAGADGYDAAAAAMLDASERAARDRLAALPDASGRGSATIDGLELSVGVRIAGSELRVDCTGLPPQVAAPTNATATGTAAVAASGLLALLPGAAVDDGLTRALTIESAPGTVGDARFPAAVSSSEVVLEGLQRALLGALRDAGANEDA
jgi:N-methylhydantoinase B